VNPINAGDTALVLVSAGFVLVMIPCLAFFYGGLVRSKNVVHIMLFSMVCMALVGVLSTQLVVDQFVRGSKEARSHADHRAAGAAVCHG
jgi:hypothetical protein